MKARVLFPIIVLCCAACQPCPPPQTGPTTSPYVVAKEVIFGAQLSVNLAGSIFNAWLNSLPANTTVNKVAVKAKFDQISTDILDGLQLALTSVNIAEEQSKTFDLSQLYTQIQGAWADLRKFLTDLGVNVPLPSTLPAVNQAKHVTSVKDLPEILLPKGK